MNKSADNPYGNNAASTVYEPTPNYQFIESAQIPQQPPEQQHQLQQPTPSAPPSIPDKEQSVSIFWLPLYILPWIAVFFLVMLSYHQLPTALLMENESLHPNRFIGERAKILSTELGAIGPKVVGSPANEVQAVQFLVAEIEKIEAAANPIHFIEHDIQRSTGCFELGSLTTCYNDIQNIIVKISPRNRTTQHSLLINSHFDSVPGSPGGGDAGILIIVMLEVLRVLSQLPNTLQNSVVFLFNSAEEIELMGSHQFITQHKWAHDVRALINMDSCGTGGREVLFQSTAFPWFMNYYKNTAPHPTATVLGDELFKMGIIPSDTDFRIFRDFGNLRGLDFAIYRNGYVYHTKYDRTDLIPMETFQNTGDNILAVTRAVANADELGDESYSDDNEDLIFFDFLGWFMLSYSITVGIIINVSVSVVSIVGILISLIFFARHCGVGFMRILSEFATTFVIQLLSWGLGVGIVILLAFVYDTAGRSMAWFSSPWLLFGIYFCPLFFCLGAGPSLYVMIRKKDVIRQSYFTQMFLHSQCLLLVILTLVLTGLGIRSTFIMVMGVIFYTLTMYINCLTRLQLRDSFWLIVHFVGQVIPCMFYSYYIIFILDMFVPIQGRNGPLTNPDNMLAVIVIGFGILVGGFLIPTLYTFKKSILVVCGFLIIFILFGIMMATNIGFPYKSAVSPRRFWTFHTVRNFYNYNGTVRRSDSGYYLRAMDRHYDDYFAAYVSHMKDAEVASTLCNTEMMCGLPSYQSMATSATSKYSHWIPSEAPILPFKSTVTVVRVSSPSINVKRLTVEVRGSDHMAMSISPLPGNKLVGWSLLNKPPLARKWGNRKLYFLMLAHGVDDSPFVIDLDIKKSNDDEASVEIALVSHFTYHVDYETQDYKSFLSSFPDWAHLTSWISSYDSWTF